MEKDWRLKASMSYGERISIEERKKKEEKEED